jgi:hypothetical protein
LIGAVLREFRGPPSARNGTWLEVLSMKSFHVSGLVVLVAVLAVAATVYAAVPEMVTITVPDGFESQSTWIKGVEFDHTVHGGLENCTFCHHMEEEGMEDYTACRECHMDTEGDSPDGFYKAWHSSQPFSCVTCHRNMGVGYSCTETCHKLP